MTIYYTYDFKAQPVINRIEHFRPIDDSTFVSVSTRENGSYCAYMWRIQNGVTELIQILDSSWKFPVTILPKYNKDGVLSSIMQGTKKIWKINNKSKTKVVSESAIINDVSYRIRDAILNKQNENLEEVLLYTLCIDMEDENYWPPQIGVIFTRDAISYSQKYKEYPEGISSIINPTFQEELNFPTNTKFPYCEIYNGKKEKIPENLLAASIKLMDVLNTNASLSDPLFLLVDLCEDSDSFINRLPADTINRLSMFNICEELIF